MFFKSSVSSKSEIQEYGPTAEKYTVDLSSTTEYYGSSGFNDAQNVADTEKFIEGTSENYQLSRKIIKSA